MEYELIEGWDEIDVIEEEEVFFDVWENEDLMGEEVVDNLYDFLMGDDEPLDNISNILMSIIDQNNKNVHSALSYRW
jgi:hypothetical protein